MSASFVFLAVYVYPFLIVAIVGVFSLLVFVSRVAIHCNHDSVRLSASTRSPINSLFVASLHSLPTIRAYQREDYFHAKYLELIDVNATALFTQQSTTSWLVYHLDLCASLFIQATLVAAFVAKAEGINTAFVALAITSAVNLSNPVKMLINIASRLTTYLANAQRMQEYASLPQESYQTEPHQIQLAWSTHTQPPTLSF